MMQLSIGCSLCGMFIPGLCGATCPLAGLFCGGSGYLCTFAKGEQSKPSVEAISILPEAEAASSPLISVNINTPAAEEAEDIEAKVVAAPRSLNPKLALHGHNTENHDTHQ